MELKPGSEQARKIDCEIAEKVMGFKPWVNFVGFMNVKTGEHGSTGDYRMRDESKSLLAEDSIISMPNYSTDIAAAWEVVEKIKGVIINGYGFGMEFTATEWTVGWFSEGGTYLGASSESVSHAICLAALQAVDFVSPALP